MVRGEEEKGGEHDLCKFWIDGAEGEPFWVSLGSGHCGEIVEVRVLWGGRAKEGKFRVETAQRSELEY